MFSTIFTFTEFLGNELRGLKAHCIFSKSLSQVSHNKIKILLSSVCPRVRKFTIEKKSTSCVPTAYRD